MNILSNEAEILLNALIEKDTGDGWIVCMKIPSQIKNNIAVKNELENEGYITKVSLPGGSNIMCNLESSAKEYFINKQKYLVKEAIDMFIPLPKDLKNILNDFTTTYKSGSYIENPSEDLENKINKLKSAGYLKKVKQDITGCFEVELSYEDEYYNFLEETNNKQTIQGNTIVAYGGQVNVASGNSIINATQNNGINLKELDILIEEVKNNFQGSNEEFNDIKDNLDELRIQVSSEQPKKGLIKNIISFLKGFTEGIKEPLEFAIAVTKLITLVTPIIAM